MILLQRRFASASLILFLLSLAAILALACDRNHTPTEFVACPSLDGGWEEVADSSCLGMRRSSLTLKQTGCTVFASSAGLQADATLALTSPDHGGVSLTFFGCSGTVKGTANVSDHRIEGQFEGTISGPSPTCCGHVKGTFLWLR
jgi:hypothetical protein